MTTNVHLPHVSGRVEFIEVDFTAYGDQVYRFCDSNPYNTDDPGAEAVQWGGLSWISRPFTSTGWKRGDTTERPKISLPDPDAALLIKIRSLNGASGATINRYVALAESVLAGVAIPLSHERYMLNKYQAIPGNKVEVELASIFDFRKSKVPSFVMTREHYPGLGSNLTR